MLIPRIPVLAGLCLCSLLFAACENENHSATNLSAPSESPALAVGLPSLILESRIRLEELVLELSVDGVLIPTERTGSRWSGELTVAEGQTVAIEVTFRSDAGIELATHFRTFTVSSQEEVVRIGQSAYRILDSDQDGFSNIEGVDAGTNVFDSSSRPEIGTDETGSPSDSENTDTGSRPEAAENTALAAIDSLPELSEFAARVRAESFSLTFEDPNNSPPSYFRAGQQYYP